MFYAVSEQERRRAKSPHELAMVNLLLFNLLAGVALLAGSMAEPDSVMARYRWVAVAVPLLLSIAVVTFTWVRAASMRGAAAWFIAAHWRLAAGRYRILLLSYALSAAVVSIGFLSGGDQQALEQRIAALPPALQEMEREKMASQDMGIAIWARIGVVPLVLTVMALLMLESGALYQAGRGELPNSLAAALPPPNGMATGSTPFPVD